MKVYRGKKTYWSWPFIILYSMVHVNTMMSWGTTSRESSSHDTYKPIGERFAYGAIPSDANLSPIGLYVPCVEDSLEGSSCDVISSSQQ